MRTLTFLALCFLYGCGTGETPALHSSMVDLGGKMIATADAQEMTTAHRGLSLLPDEQVVWYETFDKQLLVDLFAPQEVHGLRLYHAFDAQTQKRTVVFAPVDKYARLYSSTAKKSGSITVVYNPKNCPGDCAEGKSTTDILGGANSTLGVVQNMIDNHRALPLNNEQVIWLETYDKDMIAQLFTNNSVKGLRVLHVYNQATKQRKNLLIGTDANGKLLNQKANPAGDYLEGGGCPLDCPPDNL